MTTGEEILGSSDDGVIVCAPPGGMLKLITSVPPSALASSIAARRVHSPLPVAVSQTQFPTLASPPSPVELTIRVPAVAVGHWNAPSNAPMSQIAPPFPSPSRGRAAPRWSVAGGGQS